MRKISILLTALVFNTVVNAQDDLLKELEQSEKTEVDYAFQTFKGTRLVNGHSVETKPEGTLEFIFAHRFGPLAGRAYELFGLDDAQVRLGLDYGITDNLSVSIGRNSNDKTMDGYVKCKLLRQSKGGRIFPVTVTALLGMGSTPVIHPDRDAPKYHYIDRLSYVSELLIARKFTPNLSLQLMPVFVHRNAVYRDRENSNQAAIGIGGRIKMTKSVALTSEYYYRINPHKNSPYKNPVGFGIDIETGGHVFQLVMTTTRGLTERAFITETAGEFKDWQFQFGFNVTRTFQLKHKQ
jgi:hypothetical protein